MVKTIDEIINEVLGSKVITNGQHFEPQFKITRGEIHEIINKLPIIIYGENTTVDITPIGIVVKPTFMVS